MPLTYTPINSLPLESSQATVTFSNIPQTYTDLVLVVSGFTTHTDDGARGYMQFNGDTGSNYSGVYLGVMSTPARQTNKDTNQSSIPYGVLGNRSDYPATIEVNIHNYRNTSSWGLVLSKTGKYATNANYGNRLSSGSWRNTSPITSITLTCDGSYAAGTVFSLYGIASA